MTDEENVVDEVHSAGGVGELYVMPLMLCAIVFIFGAGKIISIINGYYIHWYHWLGIALIVFLQIFFGFVAWVCIIGIREYLEAQRNLRED